MGRPTSQQRDSMKKISPPWLGSGVAEKLIYAIGLGLDSLAEKMNQSVQAHLPGRCDASALPALAADRLLVQGVNEAAASFSARLKTAFDAWQRAGSRRAVLGQTVPFLQPSVPVPRVVPTGLVVGGNASLATWDVVDTTGVANGAPAHFVIAPTNWNWDGIFQWWRSWLVLLYFPLTNATGAAASITASATPGFVTVSGLTGMTSGANVTNQFLKISGAASSANNGTFQVVQVTSGTTVIIASSAAVTPDANNGAITWTSKAYPSVAPGPAWGTTGAVWGDTTRSWGLNIPATTVTTLRSILRLWKSAQTFYPWVVFAFDGEDGSPGSAFSPWSSSSSGNPDGTWGSWAKTVGGIAVSSRKTNTGFDAFADGTARYVNCFVPTDT